MPWKIATAVLGLLLSAESGYILFARQRAINRFKPVDEDGYLAFDSATGQLCRTFRPGSRPKKIQPAPIKPAPSSLDSKKSGPDDRILTAIRGGLTEAEFEKKIQEEKDANAEAHAEFIRGVPACMDIH